MQLPAGQGGGAFSFNRHGAARPQTAMEMRVPCSACLCTPWVQVGHGSPPVRFLVLDSARLSLYGQREADLPILKP